MATFLLLFSLGLALVAAGFSISMLARVFQHRPFEMQAYIACAGGILSAVISIVVELFILH